MTALPIVLLAVGGLLSLLALATVAVLATDRLRATTDKLLAVRSRVEPELTELRERAEEASRRSAAIRAARNRSRDA